MDDTNDVVETPAEANPADTEAETPAAAPSEDEEKQEVDNG